MRPATVCGIVTGDALVSYWPIFFSLPLVTVPGVFAGVNSVQFPLDCYQTPSSCPIVTRSSARNIPARGEWGDARNWDNNLTDFYYR